MNHPLSEFFQADTAGAIIGYAKGLETPKIDAIGLADIKKKEHFTDHSLFDIASLSKSFTGAAIALLVQENQLDVSLPLEHYLPSLKSSGKHRLIKVQDLLWHISDLPDYLGHFSQEQIPTLVNDDIVEFAKSHISQAKPGQSYEYSNTNYVLLAAIIEAVSSQSYVSFLEEKIIKPLELNDTVIIEPNKILKQLVNGYEKQNDGSFSESRLACYVLGDGGVFSTVRDLISWVQKYIKQNQLLTNEAAQLVFSSGHLDNGDLVQYGAGLWIEDTGNGKRFRHGGGWIGVSTYMEYDPCTDITLVALSNQTSAPVGVVEELREFVTLS